MIHNKLQALTVFSILFGFAVCMVILTLKNGQIPYQILWIALAVIDAIILTKYYKQLSNK